MPSDHAGTMHAGAGTAGSVGITPAIILSLVCALPVMAILVVAPVLPQMTAAFATTPGVNALVPICLTVPALMIALFGWPAGMVIDRFGRKRTLVGAMLLYTGFGMAPMVLSSLPAILVSRALTGMTEALIITAGITLIGDFYEGRARERALSLQTATASVGAIIFLAVGGALGEAGWRAPFLLYLLSLVLLVPVLVVLREPAMRAPARPRGFRVAGEAAGPLGRVFLSCCALSVLAGIALYVPIVQNSFLLATLGVHRASAIGMVGSAGTAAVLAGTLTYASMARIGISRLLVASFALTGVGLVIMASAATLAGFVPGVLVASLGAGIFIPALSTWALSLLPLESRARGMGLWQAAFWFGQFVSPIIILALTGALGTLHRAVGATGVAFGALTVAGVLLLLLTQKREQIS